MPLLLYCVAPETATDTSVPGVGGAAVRSEVEEALRFFYSEAANGISSKDVVSDAQSVHRVVSDIFSRTAVLPFQYPTVVTDINEIAQLAKERGVAFRKFLERVESKVQMDVRLTLESSQSPPTPDGNSGHAESGSGTAYLQGRAQRQATLSEAAETCRLAAHPAEWRIVPQAENIRCQALVERVEVVSFLERMRTLELPGGVKAAVSGPWPPAGFWEDKPR